MVKQLTNVKFDHISIDTVPIKKLAMFDLDGTLIMGHVDRPDPDGPFVQVLPFSEVILLPKVKEKIHRLREEGLAIGICTNKAGVAFGHQTEHECLDKAINVMAALECENNIRWVECYHHPQAKLEQYRGEHPWRKPNPGMLEHVMAQFGVKPSEAFFVGDMDVDQQAAEAAGVDFFWAKDYFGWE